MGISAKCYVGISDLRVVNISNRDNENVIKKPISHTTATNVHSYSVYPADVHSEYPIRPRMKNIVEQISSAYAMYEPILFSPSRRLIGFMRQRKCIGYGIVLRGDVQSGNYITFKLMTTSKESSGSSDDTIV